MDALKLYYEFIDLDFMDYNDTINQDLQLIQSIIDLYGVTAARQILKAYFD